MCIFHPRLGWRRQTTRRIGTLSAQRLTSGRNIIPIYLPENPPMPLSIKDPETERLARELAQRTGESITVAIRKALQERLRAG